MRVSLRAFSMPWGDMEDGHNSRYIMAFDNKLDELHEEHQKLFHEVQSTISEAEESGGIDNETEEQLDRKFQRMEEIREEEKRLEEHQAELEAAEAHEEKLNTRKERIVGRLAEQGFRTDEAEDRAEDYEQRAEQYRSDFHKYLRNGLDVGRDTLSRLREGPPLPPDSEYRESNVIVGTSNTGGVFAPTEFQARIFEELKDFGDMRQTRATVLQTPHGRDIQFPTDTDTSNTASRVSEASTVGSVSNVDLDLVTVHAFKFQSGPFALSREFLMDSRVEPENFIRRKIRTRIGRETEKRFVGSTGGSTKIEGILAASSGAVSIANGSSNLGFDDLYDLKHSVDRAYRAAGAEWVFTDNTFKVVSKITDSNGQFLLQPRVTQGAPQMLLGAPIRINNSSTAMEFDAVASATSKKKVIAYGDFSHYMIRDVLSVVIRRLDERFALTDKVGFVGFMRVDGRVMQDPNITAAQKPIRVLVENT